MKILVALSCLTLCDSMDFSRQEYWSEWPCLSPGDNADPGIKPRSPTLQADSLPSESPRKLHVGDLGSIPGLGRSPEEGKGYLLQYCGLENSMDYTVHGIAKSRTRLSNLGFHFPDYL